MDSGPLTAKTLKTLQQINEVAAQWELLAAQDPLRGFFRRPAWYLSWIENIRPEAQPAVITFMDGGTLVGLAPFCLLRRKWLGKSLQFGGTDVVCGDYLDVITDANYRDPVFQALFRHLNGETLKWDEAELEGISVSPDLGDALRMAGARRSFMLRTEPSAICPYIDLPETFEQYMSTLERKRRQTFKRCIKRFKENEVAIKEHSKPEELSSAIDTLMRLHLARWNHAGKKSALEHPGFREFLNSLAQQEAGNSSFRLYVMEDAGTPIAALLNFYYGTTAFQYQNGFDPACRLASYSPGLVLILHAIKAAIDQGLSCYDFLRGAESYKFHFTNRYRSTESLLLARTMLGKTSLLARTLKSRLAQLRPGVADSSDKKLANNVVQSAMKKNSSAVRNRGQAHKQTADELLMAEVPTNLPSL